MRSKRDRYIPAFGLGWLTPFFDLMLRLTMRESTFKRFLIEQAQLEKGHHVLDLGCGTGTLAIMVKRAQPGADVTGLDGDSRVLDIASAKAKKAGVNINLDQGMSFELPYPDASFDRILSTLLFHHLTFEDKRRTLKEVRRVLKPGGELHLADIGKPGNVLMYLVSLAMSKLERTSDNIRGLLPGLISETGFRNVEHVSSFMTIFGTLSLYKGVKPRSQDKFVSM